MADFFTGPLHLAELNTELLFIYVLYYLFREGAINIVLYFKKLYQK